MFKDEMFQQCRQVKFKGTMTNDPYKNKHLEQHKPRRTTRRKRHAEKMLPYFSLIFCFY